MQVESRDRAIRTIQVRIRQLESREKFLATIIQRLGATLLMTFAAFGLAQSAPYPTRAIEIVVPYSPGGATDVVARVLGPKLQDRLGRPVVVINRPGASGTIGIISVARARPDGHTLFIGYSSETVIVPQMTKTAKYSLDDFEPIVVVGLLPLVLIVSKNVQADSLKDLIEKLRTSPKKFTFGGAIGSPSHIMGGWLNRLANVDATHVPYRGGAQSVTDVIGGHIDMYYASSAAAKGAIDSGSVKALAVTGNARSSALPNVPTFNEAGVADFDLGAWTVMLAPKGTPADIVQLLRTESLAALADTKIRALLASQGVEPSSVDDVRAFLSAEQEKFGRVVRELGITLE
jgi:tripartite-type tricarboxylate transporter receptor subunit TctC